jgi:hypothetical protein
MSGSGCCQVVGDFFTHAPFSLPGCIISVNNNINTEYNDYGCGGLTGGPRIGTLNISGYVSGEIHQGCPGRAGAQVLWSRKYSCDEDKTYFIFLGPGRSFAQDGAASKVSIGSAAASTSTAISASAQSGPASLFTMSEQTEGLGMSYSHGPISFDTSTESGCTLGNMGLGIGDYYLQTFNIECVPGSVPIASYTFAYNA